MISLDLDDLSRAVGAEVSSYDVEPIDPHLRIHSVTGGVYRVRAAGSTLVVKVVRRGDGCTPDGLWGSHDEETGRNYWKREWLAFDSGLLDALPGRLRAPRTLLTTQAGPDECWVWMEDVAGRTGKQLTLDDLATIARALGTTQGAFAAGRAPLPQQPWLSRHWLRGWVEICGRFIEPLVDDSRWRDERLAPFVPLRPRLAALWEARDQLLAVADEAPPTVTHWDFWPANLHVDRAGDAVAIDWSQIGIGGVTHDLDQLTLDTVWMLVRPDESLDVLEELVLTAYAAGLRESGLDVGDGQLRRWYAAAASLRYAWLAGGQPALVADPEAAARQEQRFGTGIAAITAVKARVVERALRLGEQVLGA